MKKLSTMLLMVLCMLFSVNSASAQTATYSESIYDVTIVFPEGQSLKFESAAWIPLFFGDTMDEEEASNCFGQAEGKNVSVTDNVAVIHFEESGYAELPADATKFGCKIYKNDLMIDGAFLSADLEINITKAEESGITTITAKTSGNAYDLSGRKVNKLLPGQVYVIDGVKMIIK